MATEQERKENFMKMLEGTNQVALHISRVPPKTKQEFKDFASKEFCDDFGMAFKHIWDSYQGVLNFEVQTLLIQVNELSQRIEALEQQLLNTNMNTNINTTKEKTRTNLLGKELN